MYSIQKQDTWLMYLFLVVELYGCSGSRWSVDECQWVASVRYVVDSVFPTWGENTGNALNSFFHLSTQVGKQSMGFAFTEISSQNTVECLQHLAQQ